MRLKFFLNCFMDIPLKLFIFQSFKKIESCFGFLHMEEQREAHSLIYHVLAMCVNVQERDKCCYLNQSQVYRKSIWVRQNHIIYIVLIYLDLTCDMINLDYYSMTILHLLIVVFLIHFLIENIFKFCI